MTQRNMRATLAMLPLLPLLLAGCTAPTQEKLAPPASASVPASTSANTPAHPPRLDSKAIAEAMRQAYLGPRGLPDSAKIVAAPPAEGSAEWARDVAASQAGLALATTARFTLAAQDADLFTPTAPSALSCAAGVELGTGQIPALDHLLRRSIPDFGLSTSAAKKLYSRARPFMINHQPSCTPADEAFLRGDGSYPSGHSAIGYGWALVLAEVFPQRSAQILARGKAFGESRRICNVHWKSDIEAGQLVAQAVMDRLKTNPAFTADLAAARAQIEKSPPPAPKRDCAAEQATLALDSL